MAKSTFFLALLIISNRVFDTHSVSGKANNGQTGHLKDAEPPAFDRRSVVFSCDFESDAWYTQFGMRKRPERVKVVSSDPSRKFDAQKGKALRVKVDRGGHYGTSIMYRFKDQIGIEPEEMYFRYYLRFADDWDPAKGGKLPGISGTYNQAGWGGRPSNGRNGWSARGQFNGQRDGKTPVGYYCYHADMRGRDGAGGFGTAKNEGIWKTIAGTASSSTPR